MAKSQAQATMAFVQEPSDAEVVSEVTMVEATEPAPLKLRVRAAGHRHGKAFGSIGVVTTSYTRGFAEGFLASFKD